MVFSTKDRYPPMASDDSLCKESYVLRLEPSLVRDLRTTSNNSGLAGFDVLSLASYFCSSEASCWRSFNSFLAATLFFSTRFPISSICASRLIGISPPSALTHGADDRSGMLLAHRDHHSGLRADTVISREQRKIAGGRSGGNH